MYYTLHHWPTFYDSMKCNFTFTPVTLNYVFLSLQTINDMELTDSITKIKECLSDVDKWMSINGPKLNKDKTELLYLFLKYNPQQSLPLLRFGTESSPLHMQEILALSSIPPCQCFPMSTMFVNLPFIIFTPFPA